MNDLSLNDSIEYLRGNKNFPIFDKNKKVGYSYREIYKIIMKTSTCICKNVPSSVENTAVFLVNIKEIGVLDNILCDLMGVWSPNGTPKEFITVDDEQVRLKSIDSDQYDFCITRKYFEHSQNKSVKRTIIYMHDKFNNLCDVAILQYIFKDGPVSVKTLLKPHGNSKSDIVYSRHFESTKQKMSSTTCNTNEFRSMIIRENGGIENIDNMSVLPRNNQQIHYQRNKNKQYTDDFLLLLEKKLSSIESSIHFIQCIPELSVVLFTQQQKTDISRFCQDFAG